MFLLHATRVTTALTEMLMRLPDPWVVRALLVVTLGLYGVFGLYSLVRELHGRGATTITPGVAARSLFVPVYNVVWAIVLVSILQDAFAKAFADVGRWPPRDLSPLWGFALVPVVVSFGLVAPWPGLLVAFVLLSFTLSLARGWLRELSTLTAPVRCDAAAPVEVGAPDSLPPPNAAVVAAVDEQDDTRLAYRPIGDRSHGIEVVERGLQRLLARCELPPDRFEVRDADGPWTPLTAWRPRPVAVPAIAGHGGRPDSPRRPVSVGCDACCPREPSEPKGLERG